MLPFIAMIAKRSVGPGKGVAQSLDILGKRVG
jgi:hypothetical protein